MTPARIIPAIVARGIVRAGSRTCSAGTVADSSPSNAHKVSVAAAVMLASFKSAKPAKGGSDAFVSPPPDNTKPASKITASNGMTFRTVVTNCTEPASTAPRQLIAVSNQIDPQVTKAWSPVVSAI